MLDDAFGRTNQKIFAKFLCSRQPIQRAVEFQMHRAARDCPAPLDFWRCWRILKAETAGQSGSAIVLPDGADLRNVSNKNYEQYKTLFATGSGHCAG
ncbi:MAG TPA: hypothetical protein VFM25_06760 [Verrucomicrobiae bacterium]|nr:hypothetical protein [Verrucomicrobiae bacterium]